MVGTITYHANGDVNAPVDTSSPYITKHSSTY